MNSVTFCKFCVAMPVRAMLPACLSTQNIVEIVETIIDSNNFVASIGNTKSMQRRAQTVEYSTASSLIQLHLNFKSNFLNYSFANHSYDSKNSNRQEHFELRFQMNIHDDCVFHLNNKFFKWTLVCTSTIHYAHLSIYLLPLNFKQRVSK